MPQPAVCPWMEISIPLRCAAKCLRTIFPSASLWEFSCSIWWRIPVFSQWQSFIYMNYSWASSCKLLNVWSRYGFISPTLPLFWIWQPTKSESIIADNEQQPVLALAEQKRQRTSKKVEGFTNNVDTILELLEDHNISAICDSRLSDDSLDEEDPLSEMLRTGGYVDMSIACVIHQQRGEGRASKTCNHCEVSSFYFHKDVTFIYFFSVACMLKLFVSYYLPQTTPWQIAVTNHKIGEAL